jgi:hypothetical protein
MTQWIAAFDARADDARRQVEVSAERIVIARRVGGVEMRIGLTPRQYRGVALGVLVAEATDFLFTVRLVHADADLDVTLGHCDSEAAAQALWRRWATAFGLPRLVERGEREFDLDRTEVACAVERRRGRATLNRRNRFLARRKMGRAGAAAMVAQSVEG